ncbi:filamentation induced by cAMP protein Fic (plasmid) [Emticicia oligotrophica DSM 17448]|uniref:Filamentation induced by cAMP protein Fic n=1 Tax=Emticicia oligotrophica (strain DSM 17448 / CIP 109782 / MTCC 6937 / GPTSA100-15) TaxID=929562 RepID=A0ABM5N898_EMTOG|nr:Fic family protein [Emticicia oligotrophica]AFK05699.1 filamentation induced by cAMP protein Fic [Emticicia oligotrophica DSM 17448]
MKTELEKLTQEYKALSQNYIDLERLNLYLISHHSTAIEGSTLTVLETEIFLEKGLTAKGKPLEHHLMVKDHFESLGFIIESAKAKQKIDTKFIQNINAHIMKSTGTVHNTALGTFDSSKGDLRLLNVRAGISGESYLNYNKVPQYLKNMCTDLNSKINEVKTVEEINELAFLGHYQLVTIHPFVDGNGRTSRLLMNYIQSYHEMPMTIVFEEDRQEYIESLIETRKEGNIQIFLDFMKGQHLKFLNEEIKKLQNLTPPKKGSQRNIRLLF